jgi:hypothetical protein
MIMKKLGEENCYNYLERGVGDGGKWGGRECITKLTKGHM